MKTIKLNNGIEMPIIGLGTWKSKPEDAYKAVLAALKAGYRHIDTAAIYGNEEMVGKAIKDSKINRKDIFLTTKVWNSDQGYENTLKAFNESLAKLGTDYVDLYLIHWFKGYDLGLETYKAMEKLYKEGKVRAIGVSNHNVHHLRYLLDNAEIKPMVNQVETHISLQNHFLQDFCTKNGIQMEAYAPLMSWKIGDMLGNETMKEIAEKYNKTIPQIAIRWLIQRDIVVIPKSVHEDRIIGNFNVFDFKLDSEDIESINGLNSGRKLFTEFDNVPY